MKPWDIPNLRRTFEIALHARSLGNHPFGALLADENGNILLEAENTVVTEKDVTGHAETNLMRKASSQFAPEFLAKCSIYASTEPCPMCVGAIFWANVRRVVFGLSEGELYQVSASPGSGDVFYYPCAELFKRGKKEIEVVGPLLEEEALQVHEGFWHS